MKQAQWAGAIVVLAMMVFAVTFAMNYLGGGGGGSQGQRIDTETVHQLRFDLPVAPADGSRVECEASSKRTYHHDFWFKNENAEAAKVGLDSKSCKCVGVQLFIVPTEALARLGPLYARLVGRLAASTVSPAPAGALLQGLTRNLGWAPELLAEAEARRAVQKGIEGHELLKAEGLYEVPAGAIGWARLSWKREVVGPNTFTATLWADKKGAVTMPLQVAAAFHKPLRVQPQLVLPSLRDEDLQGAGHTAEIVCWSSTRLRFELKAEMMKLGGPANAATNPFHVGKPRPLNRAELAQLQARNNAAADHTRRGRVLSGYRVPITLTSVAADGKTPSPLGPFRRWVRLTSDDPEVESVEVEVIGRVQGVVQVGGEGDEGIVSFDSFSRTRGAAVSINLFSSVPGLTLAVDEEQAKTAARFLRVTLGQPKAEGDGRQSWTLKVTVPPNEARGEFPRPEDPEYEDSAVYLKAREKGKPERRVRIPVRGTALDG